METTELYRKKLCMTELQAGHTALTQSRYFEECREERWATFLLPVKGEAQIRTQSRTLSLVPGELAYLPEGTDRRILWLGTPEIEYFFLRIVSRQYDTQNIERFALQKVPVPAKEETERTFREIFRFLSAGDRISRVRGIGLYYGFYAEILPVLAAESPRQYHPALVRALAYIEAHDTEDFGMKTLAQEAYVSESRLFHLFREQLGVTPVRYRNELRVSRASRLLRLSDAPVEQVAEEGGFHSPAYFREIFREITGLTPSEYRQAVREKNE